MDQIESYIRNIFSSFPPGLNRDDIEAKVLRESQQRYRYLMQEGRSEQEALGMVFQEIDVESIKRNFADEEARYRNYSQRDVSQYEKAEKRERLRRILSAILWPVTTIAYLLMGFLADLWHPGWIIFVVASVFQRLIAMI
jgi:hypothetical protein